MKRKISNRYFTSSNLAVKTEAASWLRSRLCDISEWENPEFIAFAKEIMGREDAPIHRKLWEFTSTVLALKELGLFNSNTLGLSVAAGSERILYYLANNLAGIVATDIYGQGDFSELEADLSFLHNQKAFAPYPYKEENLSAAYSNALNIKFPDDSFDFSFCMSSIEHFGSIKNSRKAIAEMARVTKPGGYVFITTEVAINDYTTDEVFKVKDINNLTKNTGLTLSSNFDYSLSDQSLEHLYDMRNGDLNQLPHINLKARCSIFTSALLILRKEGKYLASKDLTNDKEKLWKIADQLKKPEKIKFSQTLISKLKKKILNLKWKIQENLI